VLRNPNGIAFGGEFRALFGSKSLLKRGVISGYTTWVYDVPDVYNYSGTWWILFGGYY
jgi:hypothetical protein